MKKHKIESICRKAGMRPERRVSIDGAECFVADGFSTPPHVSFRRFGVEPTEYPGGMYATLWWISRGEDSLDIGRPLFFELLHNPELSGQSKKVARINSAIKDATEFLRKRKRNLDG